MGKRGRPWRYDHALYLALLLYRPFFRLTYRKTEASLQDLMEGPFPSHQSLARYAVRHLDPGFLEALLERLSRELEAHLASSPSPEGDSPPEGGGEEEGKPGRPEASSPGAPPGAPSPRGWATGARTGLSASAGGRRCGGCGGTRGFWP